MICCTAPKEMSRKHHGWRNRMPGLPPQESVSSLLFGPQALKRKHSRKACLSLSLSLSPGKVRSRGPAAPRARARTRSPRDLFVPPMGFAHRGSAVQERKFGLPIFFNTDKGKARSPPSRANAPCQSRSQVWLLQQTRASVRQLLNQPPNYLYPPASSAEGDCRLWFASSQFIAG